MSMPKIIAIAGALKGSIVELGETSVTIGRDVSNTLNIDDKMVSRSHCVVRRERGLYKITDLESHNGTLINGIPIKEQVLKHGDRLQIGNNFFLFLLFENKDSVNSNSIQFDESTIHDTSTIKISLEESVYSMAVDLNLFLRVSQTVSAATSLKALQRHLLEAILEVVPAERGAILLTDEASNEPGSVFALDKLLGPMPPVRISRTVLGTVLSQGGALLTNNVLKTDAFNESESLLSAKTHSLLCVPAMLQKKPIGVVYLETSDSGVRFTENHLRIVTALTSFASGPLKTLQHMEWLEEENKRLLEDIRLEHNMIGESAPMREMYQFIAKVAPSDSTVLIRGESGTGKELIARAIHQASPRALKPFVAINCAAFTESLIESELFGYEKGAFTGAYNQKKGKLEVADGGTLFLDEVGEMSATMQTKLLRVLQEREFERVGGSRLLKANVRIIAATNRDLEAAMQNGEFRQDLYYRLNVISRVMPPLKERLEDVPLLASYFVVKYNDRCKRQVSGLSAAARECLMSYSWPGNVRELENAIERAMVLGSTDRIQVEDLPEQIVEASASAGIADTNYQLAVREAKKQVINQALNKANGNYSEAAKLLGIHPNNLHRLVRNLAPSKSTDSRSPKYSR